MFASQRLAFCNLIHLHQPTEFHHGDCIGADDEAAFIVKRMLGDACQVIAHPPTSPKKRAYCAANDVVLPTKGYLPRNDDIVLSSRFMIATPRRSEWPSSLRGQGTFWTIRQAARRERPLFFIHPDGRVDEILPL